MAGKVLYVGLVDFRTRAQLLTSPDPMTGQLRRPRGLDATCSGNAEGQNRGAQA